MAEEEQVTQLQIRLFTKQPQYAVPDAPYAIPSTVSVNELNALVNGIIKESVEARKEINFDFLVNSEFLRTSLIDHLKSKGITTESTVDVEYLERLPAPKPHDCLTHDDWVSAVSCRPPWIITGCYDNSLHIWNTKGAHKLAIPGHTSPVKAVVWVSLDDTTGVFISTSHDQTSMLWEWNILDNSVKCMIAYIGHDKSVDCVDVTSDKLRFATGSWDTSIKIWNANLRDEDESANKKAKLDRGTPRTAIMTLNSHREAVSGVKWLGDNAILASSSWDHTIKLWDVELQAPSRNIASNKPFFCLDWQPNANLLLTCSADRNIRTFDPRSNVDMPTSVIKGHTSWISAVRWSPDNEFHFLSAGHDMLLKMWDTRSPRASLYDLTGHANKLLCCDWSGRLLMSGGADNALRIYKSRVKAS